MAITDIKARKEIMENILIKMIFIVVVHLLSHVWLFETPWTGSHKASVLHYLPVFAQIHVHWVNDAI